MRSSLDFSLSDCGRHFRPCSFVVVRFSNEFNFNIDQSDPVHFHVNELIVIENLNNISYPCLGEALNIGIKKASHELIVVAHEDVYLYDEWQNDFCQALSLLEKYDPDWAVLGCAGIDLSGEVVGSWRDPHGPTSTFSKGQRFARAVALDEHLLVLRKSMSLRFDPDIPGIHGLGTDLLHSAAQRQLNSYVINAPSWHKYKDREGVLIKSPTDSIKIKNRSTLTYISDKLCCDEYISHKWSSLLPFRSTATVYERYLSPIDELKAVPNEIIECLDKPFILIGKGGGGSRLLSRMVQDCGVSLGCDVSLSGDSMEMVVAIYQAVIHRYKCSAQWQRDLSIPKLRLAAARMLMQLRPSQRQCWGFKLPESVFVLSEIAAAFPKAVYVIMTRDPLATCLRRTHMTARLDNEIGRLTLPAAYDWKKVPRESILNDPPVIHMAYSITHQWGLVKDFLQSHNITSGIYFCSFEKILADPLKELNGLSRWIGLSVSSFDLMKDVDPARATISLAIDDSNIMARLTEILEPAHNFISRVESTINCNTCQSKVFGSKQT